MFSGTGFKTTTFLLALVAVGFLSAPAQAQSSTFTISVRVTDAPVGQGNGISGVSVLLVMNGSTQLTAQTNASGNCSFSQISGTYDVTPSKPNYAFNPTTQGGTNTGDRTLFFAGSITSNGSSVQFSSATYSTSEQAGSATFTATRSGNTANAASVGYSTSDTAGLTNCNVFNGTASSRCDYAVSLGTVSFAAGETTKSISIPIVDDSFAERDESFSVSLNNPIGTSLGSPASAIVTINDNETTTGANPIAQTSFFVRQHYIDFLGREPDPGGYAGWQAIINGCASGDSACDRIHVSGAFYQSPEFQERGYFVYRLYPVSFGRKPDYAEFIPDLARVSGFLSDAQLEAARVAFVDDFVQRPAFATRYSSLGNQAYVDTLLQTAGVTFPPASKQALILALNDGTKTRARVLRDISDSSEVSQKYFNQAFVVMQYFGYLRRDPDGSYLSWIQFLDSTGDSRGMINGFVNSNEYRFRFGP